MAEAASVPRVELAQAFQLSEISASFGQLRNGAAQAALVQLRLLFLPGDKSPQFAATQCPRVECFVMCIHFAVLVLPSQTRRRRFGSLRRGASACTLGQKCDSTVAALREYRSDSLHPLHQKREGQYTGISVR